MRPTNVVDPVNKQFKDVVHDADQTEATLVCNASSSCSEDSVSDPFDITELSPLKEVKPKVMERRGSLTREVSLSLRNLFVSKSKLEVTEREHKETKTTPTEPSSRRKRLTRRVSRSLRNLFKTSKSSLYVDTESNKTKSRKEMARTFSMRSVFSGNRYKNRGELSTKHQSMRCIPSSKTQEIAISSSSKNHEIVLEPVCRKAVGLKPIHSLFPLTEEEQEKPAKQVQWMEVQWTPPENSNSTARRVLPRAPPPNRNLLQGKKHNTQEAGKASSTTRSKEALVADRGNRVRFDRSVSTPHMSRRKFVNQAHPGLYRQASTQCFISSRKLRAPVDFNTLISEYDQIACPDLVSKVQPSDGSVTGW